MSTHRPSVKERNQTSPSTERNTGSKSTTGRERARRASRLLKQVSDPLRLQLILTLSDQGRTLSGIATQLGASIPILAHHLEVLHQGGIVSVTRTGKTNSYDLTDTGLDLAHVLRGLVGEYEDSNEARRSRLLSEIGSVVDDPALWLETPNPQFGGRRPSELLGTPEEEILRITIEAAMASSFS